MRVLQIFFASRRPKERALICSILENLPPGGLISLNFVPLLGTSGGILVLLGLLSLLWLYY
jgi:hypothetical protein